MFYYNFSVLNYSSDLSLYLYIVGGLWEKDFFFLLVKIKAAEATVIPSAVSINLWNH